MRYAEVARVLLRLLDGGRAAEVDSRWAADDGVAADERAAAAAELLRATRPLPGENGDGTAFIQAAKAAPYRVGQPDAPGEETEELPMKTRYGDPVGEAAAPRRGTYPEPREKYKPRQTPEDAERALEERQRLSAALEALSSGRLRGLLPGEGRRNNGAAKDGVPNAGNYGAAEGGAPGTRNYGAAEGGVPNAGNYGAAESRAPSAGNYGAAALRSGDARTDTAGSGARARDFDRPSSGAYSGDDPEAVSEFFRRDSRRYDAGFGGG